MNDKESLTLKECYPSNKLKMGQRVRVRDCEKLFRDYNYNYHIIGEQGLELIEI